MPRVNIPGYDQPVNFPDSMSSDEINAAAKNLYEQKKAGFDKPKDTRPVRERAASNLQSMKSGDAKKQYDEAQADAAKDIATSYGRVAKDAILAGAAALAAPLTAGASLPVAAAIMAGTGAAASAAAEGAKYVMGSREVAKNFKDLAWTLGFDAATFAVGEGAGRAIGAFAKGALPKMIMKSAAKIPRGADALDLMSERTIYGLEGRLQASVGARGPAARTTLDVDIGKILQNTEKRIADLPKGARGEFGEQFGTMRAETEEVSGKIQRGLKARADTPGLVKEQAKATRQLQKAEQAVQAKPQSGYDAAVRQKVRDDADALVKKVTERLEAARGADSTKQPIDVLIKIKGDVQAFGYEHPQWREGLIFKRMAKELDGAIRANLNTAEERELYDHYNTIMKAKFDRAKVLSFANNWVNDIARRGVGALIGGGIGFETGGTKGALAGSAIGLAAPNVSAFILEKTAMNPRTGAMLRSAVDKWIQGSAGEAKQLAGRAFVTAGGRQIVEHLIDENFNR